MSAMKDGVITKKDIDSHSIGKYQYRILSGLAGVSIYEAEMQLEQQASAGDDVVEQSQRGDSPKDDLIESLLKKADDMSSNVITMQMRIESLQEEQARALEEAKRIAFDEGFSAGAQQEQKVALDKTAQGADQFSSSVKRLEEVASDYVSALDTIKKELILTALEIAKEVIEVEVKANSARIASKLSQGLMEELKEASKITLRVNPSDHGMISEKVGSMKHIEVLSDRAISVGGVVAISDIGNIDSQVNKRFERLKKSLLAEL